MSALRHNVVQYPVEDDVEYAGRHHWIILAAPAMLLAFYAVCAVLAIPKRFDRADAILYGWFLLWFGLPLFAVVAWAVIRYRTTSLTVTAAQVIQKRGWLLKTSREIPRRHIGSFTVTQSVLGRVLGYGTIRITGTGGVRVELVAARDPEAFRRAAARAAR